MNRYAIGDVQGHYDGLQRLLDKLGAVDELWFVGDLINRGPDSLAVLRFLKNLQPAPKIVLGNHDLYLLYLVYAKNPRRGPDNLDAILSAPDCDELCDWLRTRDLLIEDQNLNLVMTHAGLAPMWSLEKARAISQELKLMLHSGNYHDYFNHFFAKRPAVWSDELQGRERWLVALDYLTRMRFTTAQGVLAWGSNGNISQACEHTYPWFVCPTRQMWPATLIFGHWAALMGKTGFFKFQAVDTGFGWGGLLTALNLESLQRIQI